MSLLQPVPRSRPALFHGEAPEHCPVSRQAKVGRRASCSPTTHLESSGQRPSTRCEYERAVSVEHEASSYRAITPGGNTTTRAGDILSASAGSVRRWGTHRRPDHLLSLSAANTARVAVPGRVRDSGATCRTQGKMRRPHTPDYRMPGAETTPGVRPGVSFGCRAILRHPGTPGWQQPQD